MKNKILHKMHSTNEQQSSKVFLEQHCRWLVVIINHETIASKDERETKAI